MARKPRFSPGGLAYHVINRTMPGVELFADSGDYQAFEKALAEALERQPAMRLCAYCLMPNHFHLVLWPKADGQLSRFMQWLSMTHAARWHAHRHTGGRGHLYQSRFRSFPIQQDEHFLNVCRYVECNALRAKLVKRAENWRWGSAWAGQQPGNVLEAESWKLEGKLARWPVEKSRDWLKWLNKPQTEAELAAIRRCRDRGRPYGTDRWSAVAAKKLGIESSMRPIGRPKVKKNGKKGL